MGKLGKKTAVAVTSISQRSHRSNPGDNKHCSRYWSTNRRPRRPPQSSLFVALQREPLPSPDLALSRENPVDNRTLRILICLANACRTPAIPDFRFDLLRHELSLHSFAERQTDSHCYCTDDGPHHGHHSALFRLSVRSDLRTSTSGRDSRSTGNQHGAHCVRGDPC